MPYATVLFVVLLVIKSSNTRFILFKKGSEHDDLANNLRNTNSNLFISNLNLYYLCMLKYF